MQLRRVDDGAVARMAFVVLLGILAGVSGCTRSPERVFSASEDVGALPEIHQESIRQGLVRLFGTPSNPRLMIAKVEETGDEAAGEESEPEADETADAGNGEEAASGPDLVDAVDRNHLQHGAAVYLNRCAGCHGITGDGKGDAAPYLQPKPRDYRRGIFKFTSTAYGLKPARQDLIRTIRRGAKGTSMPAFPWMTDEDLNAVVDYVIMLSQRGEVERYVTLLAADYAEDEEIKFAEEDGYSPFLEGLDISREQWAEAEGQIVNPVSAEPANDEESVLAGRQIFMKEGCAKCHGNYGKGQTEWLSHEFLAKQESAPDSEREQINYDAWGSPAPAADITARMLHGGRRPVDIYRRIYTGINGTPMPAFGQLWAEEPDKIWHLVHYVLHIIEGGEPAVGEQSQESPGAETMEEAA